MDNDDGMNDIIDSSFNGAFSTSFSQIREHKSDIISSTSSSSDNSPIGSPVAVKRKIRPVISSDSDGDKILSDDGNVLNHDEDGGNPEKRLEQVAPSTTNRHGSIPNSSKNDNADNDPVIEISSDEEKENKENTQPTSILKKIVTQNEYRQQLDLVRKLEQETQQISNTLRVVNVGNLPDRGHSLILKKNQLESRLKEARLVLNSMDVSQIQASSNSVPVSWDDINSGVNCVQPKTFGKRGIAMFEEQKALTTELLEKIHHSLQSCPKESDFVEDPVNLRIELMPHQKHALAWLLWRENSKPSGGILADDMGLGKTLTMIALVMKSLELKHDNDTDSDEEYDESIKYNGGTLVVCPASVVNQWETEISRRTAKGAVSVNLYHGPKREEKPKKLARFDIVLTTYTIVKNECQKNGVVSKIKWRRIILDEAHQIRNYKSQTAEAVFKLNGKSKWALTGTPVHNKELDIYSLLKFLKCTPFDNLSVWKRWVADKSTGGQDRLHAVISSLMLRRTKIELIEKGTLQSMPERKWELIQVTLQPNEKQVYQKILLFSRTLFAEFLHQRAEKNNELLLNENPSLAQPNPNHEYLKMREKLLKFHKRKEIKQHEILVLLLRLRQICAHPFLISQMLSGDEDLGDVNSDEETEELNLLEQLNKLDLNEDDIHDDQPGASVSLKEASHGFFNASNPIFSKEFQSSKLKTLFNKLGHLLETDEKMIIVSSWSTLLTLIGGHLTDQNIKFVQLDGRIPVSKRQPMIDNFNNPKHPVKIMLLSLTAGGVGLNLIGGNHIFLMDLHWNPQMEIQAQDRIYRVGQKKPVFIYKLMVENSIEERIKRLQERKLEIASNILQGSKNAVTNKLSLQDLKMLFEM